MSKINFKRTVRGKLEDVVIQVTAALKQEGFAVLSRIDLHSKIKEKIGKEIPPTIILGACNPSLAYEAFVANPDVASLLPCNAVVRDVGGGRMSVEIVRPSAIMEMLGEKYLVELAGDGAFRSPRQASGRVAGGAARRRCVRLRLTGRRGQDRKFTW